MTWRTCWKSLFPATLPHEEGRGAVRTGEIISKPQLLYGFFSPAGQKGVISSFVAEILASSVMCQLPGVCLAKDSSNLEVGMP